MLTDTDKLESYYDFLCRFVKQPMQIHCSFKQKTYTFAGQESIPIDITGSYPANFNFSCTATNEIPSPITISDGTNTTTIYTTIPAGKTFELDEQGHIKIDGQEIRNQTDISYTDESMDIPFGRVDNYRKLMQIFTPNNSDLIGMKIKFSKLFGDPEDDILFHLYQLDGDLNPSVLINKYTLSNSDMQRSPQNAFEIILPFEETLDITQTYGLIIKRNASHSNSSYFILKGDAGDSLKYWDGKSWLALGNQLYFQTISPIKEGTLPVIEPPTGTITTNIPDMLTCVSENLELDTIYARSMALPVYPLKEMKICYGGKVLEGFTQNTEYSRVYQLNTSGRIVSVQENGKNYGKTFNLIFCSENPGSYYYDYDNGILYIRTSDSGAPETKVITINGGEVLASKTFTKQQRQYCYQLSVSADNLPSGLVEELPTRFYLKTSWHYFDYSLKRGFPQLSTDNDPNYQPNELLSEHATSFGLFRRTYRDDIEPWEYVTTYPIGYPFVDEQDYYLEQRILDEYPTRTDVSRNGYLYDSTGEIKLVELRCKIPGITNVEVYSYTNDNGEKRVNVNLLTREKISQTEDYLFTDSKSFVDNINNNSNILTAKYLNNATSLLLYNIEYINTEGIYPTYGLIASEIHSYLGVVPTIKDMVDYCLIWDTRTWDNYVWSGDVYSPACFRIDIPLPPSNFKLLTDKEIKTIIRRCKKVGTEVLSAYSIESKVNLGISLSTDTIEYLKYINFDLGFDLFVGDSKVTLNTPIQAHVTTMEGIQKKDLALGFSIDTQVTEILELFSQETDTDFEEDVLTGVQIEDSGDAAYIKLADSQSIGTFTTERIYLGE
jgi:hypothetical protein